MTAAEIPRAVEASRHTFIFPLNTVLFPGGLLPLKIFEQRYLEMTKVCVRESRGFGVCLIKEGREVGTPAVPQQIGCLASIVEWDMQQLGVFQLSTQGAQRFRIIDSSVQKNGLIEADIELLPADPQVAPQNQFCAEVLRAIIDKVGANHFPAPVMLDDAAWIGYRLSEVLPIGLDLKQQLLELCDPHVRLERLSGLLSSSTDAAH